MNAARTTRRLTALWTGLICLSAGAVEPAATRISPIDQAEMVLVPAGAFIYGEESRKLRSLPGFYIDRFEVSNARYHAFLLAQPQRRPSRFAGYPQFNAPEQPVVGIGWADAAAFCAWAGKRLPSEEEWEKAARGPDGRSWPWGDTPNETRFNGRSTGVYNPAAVGTHRQSDSPYGVADMAGNVCEMTATLWESPNHPSKKHVMRGGSFLNRLPDVRTTVRWAIPDEDKGTQWLGFRCVSATETVANGTGR